MVVNRSVTALLFATAFGAILSQIGFSSWDEVHRMFVFSELRLMLAFGWASVLLGAITLLLRKYAPGQLKLVSRPIRRGTMLGGVIFGVGWAISGACPGVVPVQIGEGQLGALLTLAGIVLGNYLFGVVNARFLHWNTGGCSSD